MPKRYDALFAGREALLRSHRGHDPGALQLARELARRLMCPLFACPVTRLLVEPNRSPHHRDLFSSISRTLPRAERDELLQRYYLPHREAVTSALRRALSRPGHVLHLGVHTFTPVLEGEVRRADVGLLYNPRRIAEKAFCARWRRAMLVADRTLRVRMNYPYRGASDGLTTWLRGQLNTIRYLGIELEVNQRYPFGDSRSWSALRRLLTSTLTEQAIPRDCRPTQASR